MEMRSCVDARRRGAYRAGAKDEAGAAIFADLHAYSISRILEHVTAVLTVFPHKCGLHFLGHQGWENSINSC